MTSERKSSTISDVLVQLKNMDTKNRESIRKGAAEILLQMIRVRNHDQSATTAQRDRLLCHRKWLPKLKLRLAKTKTKT